MKIGKQQKPGPASGVKRYQVEKNRKQAPVSQAMLASRRAKELDDKNRRGR